MDLGRRTRGDKELKREQGDTEEGKKWKGIDLGFHPNMLYIYIVKINKFL